MKTARFLLCADDYGLSPGVNAAIEGLAAAGRLSATSAMVTTPCWATCSGEIGQLRRSVAVGLHVNLTLGRPLGPMPVHAAGGAFPTITQWIVRSIIARKVDVAEVAAEIERQWDRFVELAGVEPDFVDGHHHVHALPGVRDALFEVIAARARRPFLLVRSPGDRPSRIVRRSAGRGKALLVSALAAGFREAAKKAGFPCNDGFSGFSAFDSRYPFADEFREFLRLPGSFPLIMCHPGFVDPDLRELDDVLERRAEEHSALAAWPDLPAIIMHPAASRRAADGAIDWAAMIASGS